MQIASPIDPVAAVEEKFGDDVLYVKMFRDETTIVVSTNRIVEVIQFLRSTPGLVYNYLSDISSVDYYPNDYGDSYDGQNDRSYRPERFGVSYHIYSMLYNRRLRVKVFAMEETPTVPTIVGLWPAANWLEREIADM
ncbi:MAG: NADH-quinone oxidoreductase subunit C, partial [Anaerolineae bacterium]|nr:NADH-quinone oxidoreductase subunit C [Anaerolineae bacterium]